MIIIIIISSSSSRSSSSSSSVNIIIRVVLSRCSAPSSPLRVSTGPGASPARPPARPPAHPPGYPFLSSSLGGKPRGKTPQALPFSCGRLKQLLSSKKKQHLANLGSSCQSSMHLRRTTQPAMSTSDALAPLYLSGGRFINT